MVSKSRLGRALIQAYSSTELTTQISVAAELWQGFPFHIESSDMNTGVMAAGTFKYGGSPYQAAALLQSRGTFNCGLLDAYDGSFFVFIPGQLNFDSELDPHLI